MKYLKSLFSEVYIKDIMERRKIERQDVLEEIVDLLCSSMGSLTNPSKIANTLKSKQGVGVSANTIRAYIGHLEDAFLFSESKRYDVKRKSYFDTPNKYYSEDLGLRNARISEKSVDSTFFSNVGRMDIIGSGVRKLYKYTPIYSDGGKPELYRFFS